MEHVGAKDVSGPIKIAVDFQSTQGFYSGIGSAAKEILSALKEESCGITFMPYTKNSSGDLNAAQRIYWESFEIPFRVLRDQADLVYSPGFAPPFFSPRPSIVTVHDIIGIAYPDNQRALSMSRFYWSKWLPAAIRRARRLTASSETTRRDLEKFLGISRERVDLVPLGASEVFQKRDKIKAKQYVGEKFGLFSPYLISVSSLETRKNHSSLVRAFARLKNQSQLDCSIVIAGKDAGELTHLKKLAAQEGVEREVLFLGYVSLEDLIWLYNGALGYVMISFYEGFGLPALEAMRCGLSGIVSKGGSLEEIALDSAVRVEPSDVDEVARAVKLFLENDQFRRNLEDLAVKRASLFSYKKTAQSLIRIFKNEIKK